MPQHGQTSEQIEAATALLPEQTKAFIRDLQRALRQNHSSGREAFAVK